VKNPPVKMWLTAKVKVSNSAAQAQLPGDQAVAVME
jgi:hypothetical protein